MVMKLADLIKKYNLNIRGVLHIGAHWGEEEPIYSACGIKDMVFFEPVKKNYEMLLDYLPKDDRIKVFNLALGNYEGDMSMYVETYNKGQSCSLMKPVIHLSQYPHIKFDEKEVVEVDKLDNIFFDRTTFNMINIDVQGYELEVFKGAEYTLDFIDIIYTEVNNAELYEGCAKVGELDLFLKTWGFERVETNWIGVTWGDALYIKK